VLRADETQKEVFSEVNCRKEIAELKKILNANDSSFSNDKEIKAVTENLFAVHMDKHYSWIGKLERSNMQY